MKLGKGGRGGRGGGALGTLASWPNNAFSVSGGVLE